MDEIQRPDEIDELLDLLSQYDEESSDEVFCDRKKIRIYELKFETPDEYVRISYNDERTINIFLNGFENCFSKNLWLKRKGRIWLSSTEKIPFKAFVGSLKSSSENSVSFFLFETNLGKFFIEMKNDLCLFLLGVSENKHSLSKDEAVDFYKNFIKDSVKLLLKSIKAKVKKNSAREIDIKIKKISYKSGYKNLKRLKTNIICSTFEVKLSGFNENFLHLCFFQDFEYSLRKNYFFDKIHFPQTAPDDSAKEKSLPNIFIQTDFYDFPENVEFEKGSVIDLPDSGPFGGFDFNVVLEDKIIACGEIVKVDDSVFGIRIGRKYRKPVKIEDENRFCVRFHSLFIPPEEIPDKTEEMAVIEFEKSLSDTHVEIISDKNKTATAEFCPELEKIAVRILD